MDEMIFTALEGYFNVLHKLGYVPFNQIVKLLVLVFYRDFVFKDYRGVLTKADYLLIEKALDCLYGTTCLIPYPDYLKMGKLHLGEMTELAQRIKNAENVKVVKVKEDVETIQDIVIGSQNS